MSLLTYQKYYDMQNVPEQTYWNKVYTTREQADSSLLHVLSLPVFAEARA
jgi:hypothetical protein